MATDIQIKGLKEINEMFMQLPKDVSKPKIWTAFWRKNSKPFIQQAKQNLNNLQGQQNETNPIRTGALERSIGFFTTRKSRKFLGGYVGPRVKGAFRSKGKSGFYGAWIEYGSEVKFGGRGFGKDQPFMKPAWEGAKQEALTNAFKDAEIVMGKAIKRHAKRTEKYGIFGR